MESPITIEQNEEVLIFRYDINDQHRFIASIERGEEGDHFFNRNVLDTYVMYTSVNYDLEIEITNQNDRITFYGINVDSGNLITSLEITSLSPEQVDAFKTQLNGLSVNAIEIVDVEDEDLPDGAQLPPLQPIPINPENIQNIQYNGEVFDIMMAESKPIADYLAEDEDNIVFVINNASAVGYPRQQLRNMYDDRLTIRYKCNHEGGLAQRIEDVNILNPYFQLNAPGPYLIPLNLMMSPLSNDNHRVWKVSSYDPPTMVGPIAARSMVTINFATNIDGGQLDVVGANHCGPGEFEEMNLEPGAFVVQGGKRRRRTYRKKKGRKSTR